MEILKFTEAQRNKGWAINSTAVWDASLSRSLQVLFVVNGMKYALLSHIIHLSWFRSLTRLKWKHFSFVDKKMSKQLTVTCVQMTSLHKFCECMKFQGRKWSSFNPKNIGLNR